MGKYLDLIRKVPHDPKPDPCERLAQEAEAQGHDLITHIKEHAPGLLPERDSAAESDAECAAERVARLDAERHERDRKLGRGYEYDCGAPGHDDFLARTGRDCACLRARPTSQPGPECDHPR